MISLEDFSTTNRAPNNEELKALRNVIAGYHAEWETISSKISDLQAQLQVLNNEKRSILGDAAPFKRALLPFRQLPEDVVREIFTACLPAGRNPTMSNTEPPVLLTQISSATRRIALTTPALWTAIHISLEVPHKYTHREASILAGRAKGVEDWLLHRSGSLPLYISVHHSKTPYKDQCIGQEIIDILISCSPRWRHVSFEHVPKFLLRVFTLTHIDVPILSSLSILSNSSNQYDNRWKSGLIWMAPMLQRLNISGMPMKPDYPVNWSNLTHVGFGIKALSWTEQTEQDFAENTANVLRQTMRLSSCYLVIPEDAELTNLAEISLPFLKLLIIVDHAYYDEMESEGILALIRAPALEAIQYNTDEEITEIPEDLINLLTQVSSLQELHMGFFGSENVDVLGDCLRYCPSLTSLRITGILGDEINNFIENSAFIQSFVHGDITKCLCPKLKTFHCSRDLSLPLRTLYELITRKNGTNQSLGRWSMLVLKIIYHPAEEHLLPYIGQITSKHVLGDMKISLKFQKWTSPYISLDKGLNDPKTREDAWWQHQSKFSTSNI